MIRMNEFPVFLFMFLHQSTLILFLKYIHYEETLNENRKYFENLGTWFKNARIRRAWCVMRPMRPRKRISRSDAVAVLDAALMRKDAVDAEGCVRRKDAYTDAL